VCGIAGIICPPEEQANRDLLERMARVLDHRGPDAHGIHVDREAGLAHTRLSIIDLATGDQPMHDADGALSLVFNGEIFNYVELREESIAAGERFATTSDTEVILHRYRQKGPECVHDFNGQWAFAVWDARSRELFLSRDRMGIRPLYYTVVDGAFVFASEIKAILQHPGVERALDPRALEQIFTFWHAIGDRTVFRGIRELPPGCSMRVRDGKIDVWRYWELGYAEPERGRTAEDYVDELLDLMVDATRLRLRADVPVGAYLSGGLDSSLITALIRHYTDNPLKTFSVAFKDADFDESEYQDDVVRHLRTEHHRTVCAREDIAEAFPNVIWHTEKPILRTAPAPLYLLSALVREHDFKVVLTGEGSDEVFGGYDIFKEAKIRRFWAAEPGSAWRPLLLKRLYPYMRSIQSLPRAYLEGFFRIRPEDLASPFFSHLPRWETTGRLKGLLSASVKAELEGYDAREDFRSMLPSGFEAWDPFHQAQYLETAGLMPGYILSSQGDRMSMSHSVEGRFPFLDHRVVELASAIPPRLKMKALDEKHILKRMAGDLVPPSVKARPKQPYRAPDARSFFPTPGAGASREYVNELLDSDRIREFGIFEPKAVGNLVRKVSSAPELGVRDDMALVGVLSTQLVASQFIHDPRSQ